MNNIREQKNKNVNIVFKNKKFLLLVCDEKGRVNYCVNHLLVDVKKVTGVKAELNSRLVNPDKPSIIIDTIGESSLIDSLVNSKKITGTLLYDKWDTF